MIIQRQILKSSLAEGCLNNCDNKDGLCEWCGTQGWCCQKNWIGNGCDGSFGGNGKHECVLKPDPLEISMDKSLTAWINLESFNEVQMDKFSNRSSQSYETFIFMKYSILNSNVSLHLECAFICLIIPTEPCHFYILIDSVCYLGKFTTMNSSIEIEGLSNNQTDYQTVYINRDNFNTSWFDTFFSTQTESQKDIWSTYIEETLG